MQIKEELPDEEDSVTSDADGEEDAAPENQDQTGGASDTEEDASEILDAESKPKNHDETGEDSSDSDNDAPELPLVSTEALTAPKGLVGTALAAESADESEDELPEGYSLLDVTCFLNKRFPGLGQAHRVSAALPLMSIAQFDKAVRCYFADLADLPDFGGERPKEEELHEEATKLERALISQGLSFELRIEKL
ncbi:hypothetical protein EBZ37_07820 [bacterium]|nr:hypothetical protein [bacterium]